MDLKNKMTVVGAAVVFAGILFGLTRQLSVLPGYIEYIDVIVNGKVSLFAAVTSNTVFVIIVFLLGYFSFGFTLIYPVLFFKAFTAGMCARLCIDVYGAWNGASYILAYIMPVSAITLLLMTLLSSSAFVFSFQSLFGGEKRQVLDRLKHQTILGLVFVLMSVFSVVWSAFLNPVVARII